MTNWISGLVLAAVVVVGGGYYVMNSGSLSVTQTEDVAEQEADAVADKVTPKLAESALSFSGSWNDLAKRGGNYVCEVNHSSKLDISSGTVYVSGTSVRGEFVSQTSVGAVASHMLKVDNKVYVWGGGMEQGIMMQASAMEGQGSTQTSGQGVRANQKYDWACRATGTDASKFVVPTNIEFVDLSAMMQGVGSIPDTR